MEDKINNIKILLDLSGGKSNYREIIKEIISSIKHLIPNYTDDKISNDDLQLLTEEIMDQIIPIYDKHFTNEEILGIIEFYKTPIGKIYLNKMGKVSYESMQ